MNVVFQSEVLLQIVMTYTLPYLLPSLESLVAKCTTSEDKGGLRIAEPDPRRFHSEGHSLVGGVRVLNTVLGFSGLGFSSLGFRV